MVEFALRSGAQGLGGYGAGVSYRGVHASVGVGVPRGAFALYYAMQTDDGACEAGGEETGSLGTYSVFDCEGRFQQVGLQYRLIADLGTFRPWVGFGAGIFTRAGTGTRSYQPAPSEAWQFESNEATSFSADSGGLLPFMVYGGEYVINDYLGLGAELQLGIWEF